MININDTCIYCGVYLPEGEGTICKTCLENSRKPQHIVNKSNRSIKNIHIENSYKIWTTGHMTSKIRIQCYANYGTINACEVLNRSYRGMYIEWYLHNIGYWLTLPFIKNQTIKSLNERFKHVDLEEHQ